MASDVALPALQPRDAVLRMAPYSPPTGGRADKLRLDFNENTIGCSPKVVAYLKNALEANLFAVYPEYAETRAALARFFKVDEPQIVLTNGTDEAIQVLVNTFVDDDDEVLVLHPTYAMYRFYAEVAGAQVKELPYRHGTLEFPSEELLAAITPATRAVLIANPNNPTGTGVDLASVERILQAAPHCAVLIDEAYFEFSKVTALPLVAKYPNLFVSRTFSKVFGMAAMRIGVILTQARNAAMMRKCQSPYSVNLLGAIAVRAAIQDTEFVENYVNEVLAARDLAYAGLARLGIRTYPSQANFILFEAGDRSIPIRDALRARGVLVRDRSYEIAGCVRVTIGTRAQIERFLNELEQLW